MKVTVNHLYSHGGKSSALYLLATGFATGRVAMYRIVRGYGCDGLLPEVRIPDGAKKERRAKALKPAPRSLEAL